MKKKRIFLVYHKEYDDNDSPVWKPVYCTANREKALEMINKEEIPQMYAIACIDLYE